MQQVEEYKTISEPTLGEYKAKGSKFLAYAYPFSNEAELKAILEGHKKEHFKAVHFCYAYRIGEDGKTFRVNDDGEPSGSAGNPILSQIDSHNLTQVLIVVVRYFGGTLLGVSGLIKAYKTASKEALDKAQIITHQVKKTFTLEMDYKHLNSCLHFLQKLDIEVVDKQMQLNCKLTLAVPLKSQEAFFNYMDNKPYYKLNNVDV